MNKYKCKDFIILKYKIPSYKKRVSINKRNMLQDIHDFNRILFNTFSNLSEYVLCITYNPSIFDINECMERSFMFSTGVVFEEERRSRVYMIPNNRQDIADYINNKFPHPEYLKIMKKISVLDWSMNHRDQLNISFHKDMKKLKRTDNIPYDRLLGYNEYIVKERKRKIKNILNEKN